jgi:eukaryotic-like serine/threonine-protein kinase
VNDASDRTRPPPGADSTAETWAKPPTGDSLGSSSRPGIVEEVTVDVASASFAERYERRRLLGRGGIGEVHLCRDAHVGRDVAMKLLRPSEGSAPSSASRARFVREARVQGQLEHPNIVPVYELGVTPDGAEFFTMKRIGGVTLEQIVTGLRSGDDAMKREFPPNKLLGLFRQVCLAVEYAHARGVVHRDLKPSNIMIGDFGEVYLLDWGLAKVVAQEGPAIEASSGAKTVEGQILGTLGYMAPEQLVGDPNVDPRTDVYGLGAMLFEILTLEPLHVGASMADVMRSTHLGAEARPSIRVPGAEVAPELEEVCVRATQADRSARDLTARDIADAIERHLEGDRDVELRRGLAKRHILEAEKYATLTFSGGPGAEAARERALQAVGRALALDPKSPAATATVMRLMLEPPSELPPAVRESIRRDELDEVRYQAKFGAIGYALFAVLLAVCMVMLGVKNWTAIAFVAVPLVGAAAVCAIGRATLLKTHYTPWMGWTVGALSFASIGASASMFGALVFVPGLAVANLMSLYVGPLRRQIGVLVAMACLSILVPFALEWTGVIPTSYEFRDNVIVILPGAFEFPDLNTRLGLVGGAIATVILSIMTVLNGSHVLTRAREHAHPHARQLEKLVPSEAVSRADDTGVFRVPS